MKNFTSLLCLVFLAMHIVQAQNIIPRCATDEIHQKLMDTSPEYVQNRKLIEKTYRDAIKYVEQNGSLPEATYTIPVVFHIMHDPGDAIGTGTNISLARIQQEIDNWNDAFNNTGAYAGGPFYSNAGVSSTAVDINFVLATRDPLGFPTDGVTRFPFEFGSPLYTDFAGEDTGTTLDRDMQALINWNTQDYFNVWVVDEICSTPGNCGVAGYAYLPGGFGEFYDGSVVQDDYIGVNTDLSKIMVHEVGHFFNLRHTFLGSCTETNCLTGGDFVCDTPPDASTSATSCASMNTANTCSNDAAIINSPFATDVQDIYENYMDYGFQSCQNTFTPNQATRMEAVLMSGGGRQSLASSNGGSLPTVLTPQVAFSMDSRTSFEGTTTNSGICEGYRDIPVMVKVSQAVATVVNISSTGTATEGRDYEVLNPTLTFTALSENFQFVNIRIYDDEIVEGLENIVLSYTITGGATPAASNQTMTITIKDDDILPGQLVFEEDFESGQNGWTYSSFGGFTNQFRVGPNAGLTGSGAAYVTDNTSTLPLSYNNAAADNPVIFSPMIDGTTASGATFSFTYKANGSGDDVGRLIYRVNGETNFTIFGNNYTNNGNTVNTESITLPSVLDNQEFEIGFYWNNSNGNGIGSNPPFAIDDVSISVSGAAVETSTASKDAYFGPNETIYFYSTGGQLMAKLQNNSSHDYGCTTLAIDRAGTSASTGVADYGIYEFTSKSITVTPTNNNPSGTYEITIYYAEAEIAGWEAAAGDTRANLNMVKTSGDIANAQSANSVVVEAVANSYGSDWAYTASFSSGFSGFGLANVPSGAILPLDLMKFDAQKRTSTVLLHWLTENEINTSHFEVERSKNGEVFEKIGEVKADGLIKNNYQLTDFNPLEGINYYRLKMIDLDQTTTYSQIVAIEFEPDFSVLVRPNPIISNEINLIINSIADGELQLNLRDTRGLNIKSENFWIEEGISENILQLDNLPKGIYFLSIQKGDAVQVIRIVNQ